MADVTIEHSHQQAIKGNSLTTENATGGSVELVEYRFPIEELPNKTFTLIPLSDIQWDGTEESTATGLLKETIQRGMEQGAYFVGLGDFVDGFSPSNRQRLRNANLYDTGTGIIQQAGERLVNEVYEILKPTTGRWLGLGEGHHYQDFLDGTTSDMRLANLLQTRHLGTSAFIHLVFTRKGGSSVAVTLWMSHGCGGGASPAAPVNKLDTRILPAYVADIYLLAHMTRLAHTVVNRIEPVWGGTDPTLRHLDQHLVGVGGYSRGVQVKKRQGQVPRGSYIEENMLRPTSLGSPTIRIQPLRVYEGKHDILTRRITVEI